MPLPQSSKGKTYAQSEVHYLTSTQFLVLSRDGHGHGDDDDEADSVYKCVQSGCRGRAESFSVSAELDIRLLFFSFLLFTAALSATDKRT